MMSPSEVELLPGLDGICNELLQEDGYVFCFFDWYLFFALLHNWIASSLLSQICCQVTQRFYRISTAELVLLY